MKFSGVFTAITTPFSNGKIDEKAFGDSVKRQILSGADGIVVGSTTGEGGFLTADDKLLLLKTAASAKDALFSSKAAKRFSIIAGVSGMKTETAVNEAKALTSLKRGIEVDGVLVLSPYYQKCTELGAIKHFYAVADASEAPVIVYNVPGRTGYDLSVPAIKELIKHKNIVGIKEASRDLNKIMEITSTAGDEFSVLCGSDELFLPELSIGAAGCVSVLSNVAPKLVKAIYESYISGETVSAKALHLFSLPLIKALFSDVNPVPVKRALSFIAGYSDEVTAPLTELTADKKRALIKTLGEFIKKEPELLGGRREILKSDSTE